MKFTQIFSTLYYRIAFFTNDLNYSIVAALFTLITNIHKLKQYPDLLVRLQLQKFNRLVKTIFSLVAKIVALWFTVALGFNH